MSRRSLVAALGQAALRRVGPLVAAPVDALGAKVLWHRSAASRRRSAAESLGPEERVAALGEIARRYGEPRLFEDPAAFFGDVRAIEPEVRDVGSLRDRAVRAAVLDLSWASRATPFAEELGARALATRENLTARARLFRGEARPGGRPLAILVHGYRGGSFPFEERVWPIAPLLRRGLDVALFQLPHHGLRAPAGKGPRFPGSDPRMTNEGFGQAIRDLRDLVHHGRGALGAPAAAALGMSLGGYTVSLLATVEERLDFVAPIIPLACLADAAREAGRLVGDEAQQAAQHAALAGAYRVASPLARASRLGPGRALVVAAAGDRITPLPHARRIAAHLGAPLVTFPGGHVLQLGRGEAFREIFGRLAALGLASH